MSQPLHPCPFELPNPVSPERPRPAWVVVGPDGSHASRALRRVLGLDERSRLDASQVRFVDGLAAAVTSVVRGDAERAVVPWRNALGGAVFETVDAVLGQAAHIEHALRLPIRHVLAAPPGTRVETIRTIASHPEALRQCRVLLERLRARPVAAESTAAAAAKVARNDGFADAALCDALAAERAGLAICVGDAADAPGNETTFVVVTRTPTATLRAGAVYDLGIVALTCVDTPGVLRRCLSVLEEHGLDLAAIESRPLPATPHAVRFVLEVRRHEGAAMRAALDDFAPLCRRVRWLGGGRAEGTPTWQPSSSPRAAAPSVAAAQDRVVDPFETPGGDSAAATPAVVRGGSKRPSPPRDGRTRWVDRRHDGARTVVEIADGRVRIGDGSFALLAGPCSVESAEQIEACARLAAETGVAVLRGGTFKPRTSPYAFQGLGLEGLELLARAGRRHGLPVVTEVLEPALVERCAEHADVLQVGARNMHNFPLLAALGEIDRPVLLKRGMAASLDELLYAAEYVLARGNRRVILCERGIRTFETATRFTLDLSAVVVLKERTHLPVIVDPSHAAGARRFVPPLARAAKAVGADGIIVEVHPDPDRARSDGPQALTFDTWRRLAAELTGGTA
ncbi:MAG: 3-deoxy-7-phosphoheptulonate synthase [Deltaproteobacteria bacterium]|nr:MAG: 3-deoxy-7-phosphoheptulonate synthase [Deltaproteobacteria bacterium]